ncbi:MAG: hypothetical protein M5U12_06680 [Verrucomicrobia bacterium]|nr:hypothetical protein [Verrucomicrobiota bacterium]
MAAEHNLSVDTVIQMFGIKSTTKPQENRDERSENAGDAGRADDAT